MLKMDGLGESLNDNMCMMMMVVGRGVLFVLKYYGRVAVHRDKYLTHSLGKYTGSERGLNQECMNELFTLNNR